MTKQTKTFSDFDCFYDDDQDFHIKTLAERRLITPNAGLDDDEEFFSNMHNLSENDDLPISDRAMLHPYYRYE